MGASGFGEIAQAGSVGSERSNPTPTHGMDEAWWRIQGGWDGRRQGRRERLLARGGTSGGAEEFCKRVMKRRKGN